MSIKNLLPILLILILTSCSPGKDWVQFRGQGGLGVTSARISPPLGVKWKINLQPDDERIASLNPPVVIGDTIYFGSDDGNFYALDVESGYMRWVFRAGAEINSIPYADNEKVYFGSKDWKLYALSREDGSEVWSFETNNEVNSQVERYKDYIIFVSDADAVYYLSPDGEIEFIIDNPYWMNFQFLMADDVKYFSTGPGGQIGPFDINSREFLWFLPRYEIDAYWYSFPAVRNNLLFMATAEFRDRWAMDFSFYALDRHNGRIIWARDIEGVYNIRGWNEYDEFELFLRNLNMLDWMAPTVWRDLVIYTAGDVKARAFEAETGNLRWETTFDTPVSSSATIAGDRIYFGLIDYGEHPARIVCLDVRSGRLLWSMETEGALLSAPVIAGKRIIFGTDKSVFYVLEEVF